MLNEKVFVFQPNEKQKLIAAFFAENLPISGDICNICMVNHSNIVNPICLHGGLCNECVINISKVKPECPFCRGVNSFVVKK